MCDICRRHPCHPSCPNAPEPEKVFTCSGCGESIAVGDKYIEVDGDVLCEPCIDSMDSKELLELFGVEWETADEDDIDDGSDYLYERSKYDKMMESL